MFGVAGIQHKVRLGKYKRDSDSLQREGEYVQAVWSPDVKLIAVLVSVLLILDTILAVSFNLLIENFVMPFQIFCVLQPKIAFFLHYVLRFMF